VNLALRVVKKSFSGRGLSVLRKAGLAVLLVGVAYLVVYAWSRLSSPDRQHRARAADILRRLRSLPTARYCEDDDEPRMAELRHLARAARPVIMEFLRQLRETRKPDYGLPTCWHEDDYIVNLALGLDRDGSHAREVAKVFLLPVLATQEPLSSPLPRALLQSDRMHPDPETAGLLFNAELALIERGRGPVRGPHNFPTVYPTLAQLARHLGPQHARAFVPRLLARLGEDSAIPGTLASLAPLLGPDETLPIARAMLKSIKRDAEVPAIVSLSERLSAAQVELLVSELLEEASRDRLSYSFNGQSGRSFRLWRDLVGSWAARLGPVEMARAGQRALDVLWREGESQNLAALGLAFAPLLADLGRDQVAPVVRRVLARLVVEHELILNMLSDRLTPLLGKADPADVYLAGRRLYDRMIADAAKRDTALCAPFGEWAPALAAADAFDLSRSLAHELVRARPIHIAAAFSGVLEKLGTRLDSKQSLAIARILVKHLAFDDPPALPGQPGPSASWTARLRFCVQVLAQQLATEDAHAFVLDLKSRIATEKAPATAAWLKELLQSAGQPPIPPPAADWGAIYRQREEITTMTVLGEIAGLPPRPAAGEEISPYVESLLVNLPKVKRPARRTLIIKELIRITSAWRKPLALGALKRPVSVQQLYIDLLKECFVGAEEWKLLVQALQTASGRSTDSGLWDYVTWTEQNDAGRALGLDWNRPPPWE
jgi:hypothetical protein